MNTLFSVLAVLCIPSLAWLLCLWFHQRSHKRDWHYCAECGCYIDPKGHAHERMPYGSEFNEINDRFINCQGHQ